MADLPTNFLDDILSASMGGKRRFKITHLNGTSEEVTIEDISKYDQVGSTFGAGDINKTNQAVNEKFDSGDVVDPMLTTEPGFAADAYHTKLQFDEQNKNMKSSYDAINSNIDKIANGLTRQVGYVSEGTTLLEVLISNGYFITGVFKNLSDLPVQNVEYIVYSFGQTVGGLRICVYAQEFSSSSGSKNLYVRNVFNGSWLEGWWKLAS